MIKVFTITTTFVAIAIVTLFALTPQASAGHCADGLVHVNANSCVTFTPFTFPTLPENKVIVFGVPIIISLPEALGGGGTNPERIYTATPLPIGLSFNPNTRKITGRPEILATTIVNYRVGDVATGNADEQSKTVTFTIVVSDLSITAFPNANRAFTVGETVAFNLPTGIAGTPPYSYTLTGVDGAVLPDGLIWNTDVTPQTITGVPITVTPRVNFNYRLRDSLGSTRSTSFNITVIAQSDIAPAFGTDDYIDLFYTVGMPIGEISLPEVATQGNGATTYVLHSIPPGLSFDPIRRVLSGTPTVVITSSSVYQASDGDMNTATEDADFITVSFRLQRKVVLSVIPETVEESATAKRITLTATLVGDAFSANKTISYQSAGGTATATTDYTPIVTTNLIIPEGQTSASTTISFTTVEDELDEPGGETVLITGTSANNEIRVTPATITILDEFSSLDFGGDNDVTSNDGLILYLVASGVNASALAIFVDGPGTTSEKTDRLTALENRLETDTTLDFGGDENVTSNDGLILYLVASGVNASALAIFVDGPGTTSEKIDRLNELQTRIDTENGE